MKQYYMEKCSHDFRPAIADVSKMQLVGSREGYVISRINTPYKCRGKGLARMLLQRIFADADEEQVDLYLEISPSDGLTFEELEAWYLRAGFVQIANNMYWRQPKEI